MQIAEAVRSVIGLASVRAALVSQQDSTPFGRNGEQLTGVGWQGFADVGLLWKGLLSLTLAAVLAAVIAYHPMRPRTIRSLDEAEAPRVYIVYAVVGALIGLMVLRYGMVVGLVVFGIGGLMRFRTDVQSAPKTGRLILVTLTGLSCGLDLPHLAVLTTAFGFALIFLLDSTATYRILIKGLDPRTLASTADAYRAILERADCRVLSEKKDFDRHQAAFIFRAPYRLRRSQLTHAFAADVPDALRGAVDWEID
jgi:hypothetical protein